MVHIPHQRPVGAKAASSLLNTPDSMLVLGVGIIEFSWRLIPFRRGETVPVLLDAHARHRLQKLASLLRLHLLHQVYA